MAELVDALGLGSSEVIRGGSSPLSDIGARYADSIEGDRPSTTGIFRRVVRESQHKAFPFAELVQR